MNIWQNIKIFSIVDIPWRFLGLIALCCAFLAAFAAKLIKPSFVFIFLAILNEFIWRNFPTDFWVQFKVFGMMTASIIFTFSQIPFMMREMKKLENS